MTTTIAGRMQVHTVTGGGGVRLHVREWGRADRPPILFIHGWSQNHLCWARQYESELTGEFRLVAYDLRGHGMSEAPLGPGHYTDGKLWADDVAAIIEELGLGQLVLVGWSYGAFVICDYVRAYGQDRIAAIDFVGSPATVMAKLQPMITASEADELMIITAVYDHDARKKSYSLLADAFGLAKQAAA